MISYVCASYPKNGGDIIKKFSLFFIGILLVFSIFTPRHVLADRTYYPSGNYKNAIVLEGFVDKNKTAAIFQFSKNSDSQLFITADYGESNSDTLKEKIHSRYENETYYEAGLITKNGEIKNHVAPIGGDSKQAPLDEWNAQGTSTEAGDVLAVYTLETAKSFWFDANGQNGNLPPSYLIDLEKKSQSPNGTKNRSISTLYYLVTKNGFERIKLEDIGDITIYQDENLDNKVENYLKTNYGLDVDISISDSDKQKIKNVGNYNNIQLNTSDKRLQEIFKNIYDNDGDGELDKGITVHVKKQEEKPNPAPTPQPDKEKFNLTVPDNLIFNDYTLGFTDNLVKLSSPANVQIEDNKNKGWKLSLSTTTDNALGKNLIFKKNDNSITYLSQSNTEVASGFGDYKLNLQDYLFVKMPNDRSFLAQSYETQLTWNLASTPQ